MLAGRGHASETPASDGWTPMAAVLKVRTGIDPLTLYAPTVKSGRESWIFQLPGRREAEIPFTLPAGRGLVLVQAFRDVRPNLTVPDDQVLIPGGSIPALALRAGVYRIRAIRPDGEVIAEQTITIPH